MHFVKYTYVDVYYNAGEEKQAKQEGTRLKKLGYTLENEDSGNKEFDYCDQYLRYSPNQITERKK